MVIDGDNFDAFLYNNFDYPYDYNQTSTDT